ncbi:MAG: hypothetical protein ACX94A_13550 [Algiphilus sp.]
MVKALAGLSMGMLAGCSNDPGKPQVVVQIVWTAPLPAAGEATVQLLPQRASAGLPVFTGNAPVSAGATEASVTVPHDPAAAERLEYRVSARLDAPGILLLGRSEETRVLDEDGDRVRITLDPL